MRKILFRGKIIGITDWIYGYYAKSGENHFILLDTDSEDNYSIVSPETVGQYTGLTDKNGKKIFEGDIVQWTDGLNTCKSSVEYCGDKYNYPAFDLVKHDYECNGLQFIDEDCCVEVIGNIYDNPELLGENKMNTITLSCGNCRYYYNGQCSYGGQCFGIPQLRYADGKWCGVPIEKNYGEKG